MRLNNFSPAVAAKVLAASLSDDALLEFLDLPAVVQGDHVAALAKLELAFSEPALASDLRFHSLRMLPHESVFSFARRLRQAFASAYPALLNTPASEVMLKQRFLQSLVSASVRQSLLFDTTTEQKTFSALVEAAARLLSIELASSPFVPAPVAVSSEHDFLNAVVAPVSSAESRDSSSFRRLSDRVTALESRLAGLETLPSSLQSMGESLLSLTTLVQTVASKVDSLSVSGVPGPTDPLACTSSPRSSSLTCFRCASSSHLANQCDAPPSSLICDFCGTTGGHKTVACRKRLASAHSRPSLASGSPRSGFRSRP